MQELARNALLAQTTEPMLAYKRIETACCLCARRFAISDMSLGAARAIRAAAGLVGFAYRSIARQTDLVGVAKEV